MENFKNNPQLFEENAEILKALAHPVRLCIVKGLLQAGESNVSNMQSCLNMPQSTISQHIAKLKSVGIITGERNGLEIIYKVSNPKVISIINALF
ncbi:transcriptional regulator, ArsR family [Alkalithermobacter thermoalcaliphilus JW-YL-7 = DSM 7308]|uniref:Transcriptional regulator, ArsR family n=1 Tax=Alkalithermobacter thermoalcaliphilus JW-YL-7 = DSM 7308 TaxID=1121328 RepID=A0A150FNF2_CLOPD|nr:transcriptional regulator, ArsR family [[Clostridium] paradoxum JW-YL-7 = DSM 7308]SHK92131.1 transcriptional regulator, ArsR family [[Clostridium] paradoxum JW-YL-7 = DSM 7308]